MGSYGKTNIQTKRKIFELKLRVYFFCSMKTHCTTSRPVCRTGCKPSEIQNHPHQLALRCPLARTIDLLSGIICGSSCVEPRPNALLRDSLIISLPADLDFLQHARFHWPVQIGCTSSKSRYDLWIRCERPSPIRT